MVVVCVVNGGGVCGEWWWCVCDDWWWCVMGGWCVCV